MTTVLSYAGGATAAAWGIAHLIPTRNVVAGFGALSDDNRNIITMEWITEGVFLIFLGALIVVTTTIDQGAQVSRAVSFAAAAGLVALTVVSLFTGFKVRFLPYRLCPVIFTTSAALILAGALV